MVDTVPITVIVPTVYAPPRAWAAAELLREQVDEVGGEILVASGHEVVSPAPEDPCRVVHVPGADVFALRAAACVEARGEVVAVIEDHIAVPPDYCRKVLAAFDDRDALAIVSTVENGAHGLLDRASFLLTWAPFLPPLPDLPDDRSPPPGAIAFRRSVLPSTVPPSGWLEYELPASIRDGGAMAVVDDIRVVHDQRVGWRGFTLQYHAGRGYGGLDHEPVSTYRRRERLRYAASMPRVLYRQTRDGLRRGGHRETVACMSLVVAFAACNALGQAVGVLRGPGRSPSHLE